MAKELAPRVNPKEYESDIYKFWIENNLFHADENSKKPPYSIVIPPPNVTGSLHMGHALNSTLQDILIRYHKLKGYETMWIPGTDHAGIATQTVVERKLAAEGKKRLEIGRDAFIQEVWKWKEESGNNIISQLKSLGAACDWQREKFTMDESLSKAVRKVFATLYNEGLIYRSNYMVNWCGHCQTALSDLEVEFKDQPGNLYHLKYPLEDGSGYVEIATTRPETYMADTAIAVHPDDARYKNLIGKLIVLPIIGRKIPIIADEYVDMDFGTGCLKITPAHDINDFQLGKKHNLEEISCIDENGIITTEGPFKGLNIEEARQAVEKEFVKLGLFAGKEPISHSVGHCYRCDNTIEPRVSLQWFVKVAPLATEAIKAVREGKTRIVPEVWEKNYFEWMENIRDWCISRQIWWGHRIPAWHCRSCSHITVSEEDVDICESCKSSNIYQETDVLDTWFSSALWPFSTQGWPDNTPTLKKFYPTTVLVTAFDILFFWVARMMMMGLKFMGNVPFHDVYIHALVRDEQGQKMSKTRGNVIDPLSIIDKYGADALRFSLTAFAAQGRDIKLSESRIEGYRNFVNKIWNASRFLFMNMPDTIPPLELQKLRNEDKWILTKLSEMTEKVSASIENYQFNEAASALYNFFWMTFCDWYVELIKDRLFKDDAKDAALATAAYVLDKALIAMHPIMPFVTEHIWQNLNNAEGCKRTIMQAEYPNSEHKFNLESDIIDNVIQFITCVRNIRGEYNVNPGNLVDVIIVSENNNIKQIIENNYSLIQKIARLNKVSFEKTPPAKSASQVASGYAVYIPLSGLINKEAELARLNKEIKALQKDYNLYSGKLKNERYLSKAAPEVIEKDKAKVADLEGKLKQLETAIKNLE